ncbi:hypothetical protein V2A84_11045 [Yersinia sp. 2553 StPb PI]|uniref:hypothetical protein n=1 Tax=Yersinia sp. 2553 StPb PI TaxID=3117411 RepID=UPI003FA43B41
MLIIVQFADDKNEIIVAYLSSPQDPEYYPCQGSIEASDPRWLAYYESLSSYGRDGLPAPEPS